MGVFPAASRAAAPILRSLEIMKVWPLLAAGVSLALAAPVARAEAIKRELTDNERLEYSVAESQVIVRGKLLEVVDAMVPVPGAAKLTSYRYALVAPEKWIKGAPAWVKGTSQNKPVVVGFKDGEDDLFQTIRGWAGSSNAVILFLKKPESTKSFPAPAAGSKLASVDY